MSTEVKAVPNVPPALRTLVGVAIGAASVCWLEPNQDGERVFDTTQALEVADELVGHIEKAWDDREAVVFAHLRNLSFNLGQLPGGSVHLDAARRGVANILELLERPRR